MRSPLGISRPRPPWEWYAAGLCLGLALIFLLPATLGGRALLPGTSLAHFLPWSSESRLLEQEPGWNPLLWDALAQYYPWRWFLRENLVAGRLPLWNPYQFAGMPFLANGQSAVYYPLNWVAFLLLPFEAAFGWLAWLHLGLAGFFTLSFLRALGVRRGAALVGGVAYAFCGFMVTWLELPTLVHTATWLPALLWGLERSAQGRPLAVVGGGLSLAMAVLAGHLQVLVYVALAGLAYTLFRLATPPGGQVRRPLPLLVIWLIGGLFGAAQALPSLELVGWSHRQATPSEAGYQGYLDRALSPLNLVTFFLPDFFGHPTRGDYWGPGNPRRPLRSPGDYTEFNGYLGLLPLWLALWGWLPSRRPEGRFFAGLALVALILSFGAGLNRWLYFHVPGFSGGGGPCRMVLLYLFATSVLAALGAESWLEGGARPDRRRWWWVGLGLLALAAGAWLFTWSAVGLMPGVPSGWAERLVSQGRPLLQAAVFFVAAGAWLRLGVRRRMWVRAAGLAGLVWLDLLAFGFGFNPTAKRPTLYQSQAVRQSWQSDSHARTLILPPRWALHTFPRALFPPNTGMVYGLRQLQGYDSLYPAASKQWLNTVEGREASPPENGNMVFAGRADPRWWELLGVTRLLSYQAVPAWVEAGWRESRQGRVYVYDAPGEASRARLLLPLQRHAVREMGVPRRVVEEMRAGGSSPMDRLILEGQEPRAVETIRRPDPGGRQEEVGWLRDEPNRVQLGVHSWGAWLLLADAYLPGWQTWVDAQPGLIFRAQGLLRAVWAPAGEHRVTFVYRPMAIRLGQFLLAVGALLAAGWASAACSARPRLDG